ncbi:hypothetical protein PT974_11066 [Cladobotryum mycophilum]|uniref:Pheromone n=1 Tax=Cladobotryum mycophilum TaxID=491253 RepID=A0ABR0SC42_9HYPO
MKAQLLLVAALATTALAASAPSAEEECGPLGVMTFDPNDLPEGVNPEDVRKCAEHPLSAANLWGYRKWVPKWVPF